MVKLVLMFPNGYLTSANKR